MIDFINVSKTYPNGTHALYGITLSIDKGEFVFIVGASGAGKSTFLKLIMHEETPTSGKIVINDTDVTKLRRSKVPYIRRHMGIVFQDFRLIDKMNVFDNVAFAMRAVGKPSAVIKKRVPYVLELVGLKDKMKNRPSELSGGEQQRVSLARALVNNPEIIIADEPTTALDVTIQAQIMELMKEMKEKTGVSIMLITHDMGVVAEMADKIMVMYAGMVIEYATAREIFKDPKHPYTKGLLASIPRKDKDIDRLYTIEGTVPSLTSMPKGCRFCDRCTCAMEKCRNEQPPMYQFGERSVRCFLYEDKGGVSDER